jgi:hypothetical protein
VKIQLRRKQRWLCKCFEIIGLYFLLKFVLSCSVFFYFLCQCVFVPVINYNFFAFHYFRILGSFANFRTESITFVLSSVRPSVRPFVRMEQFGFHWTNFEKKIFIKFVEKIKTRNLYPAIFFSENRTVYEIMSKNVAKPERPR